MSTAAASLFHPLRVKRITPEADDAVVVAFDVPAELQAVFRHAPGQHLTLRHTLADGEARRSYSICSAAGDAELRVGVRRVPGGAFSGWLHEVLAPGDVVAVMPPEGRFTLPPRAAGARGRHVLCIAGGSGITPILSIAQSLLEAEPDARVSLIYGNRRQATTMFGEALDDLKDRHLARFTLHHVFSQEATELPLHRGRLDATKLAEFIGPLIDPAGIDEVFICGPHGLNDGAEAALLAAGVPGERIHVERFGVPVDRAAPAVPIAREGDAATARITIVRDGVSRDIGFHLGQASILDAAAAAGLDLPFSCRSGVCCTCRARVLEGEVRMERNFALEKREVAAGFVLACQAHPLSERVVLSFDHR